MLGLVRSGLAVGSVQVVQTRSMGTAWMRSSMVCALGAEVQDEAEAEGVAKCGA